MIEGKCSKYCPIFFVSHTTIDSNGYPVYRRRDNDSFIMKGESFVDNKFVVPYNKNYFSSSTPILMSNGAINLDPSSISLSILTRDIIGLLQKIYSSGDTIDETQLYYACRYLLLVKQYGTLLVLMLIIESLLLND